MVQNWDRMDGTGLGEAELTGLMGQDLVKRN